jgi:predicted kinase
MTQTLTLTRGLPASGKSTWAEKMLLAFPEELVRLERDLLRDQLYGPMGRVYVNKPELDMTDEQFVEFMRERESTVSKVQEAMAKAAIAAGKSVIISDTNLRAKYVREWAKKAAEWNVEFRTVKFDDLTLNELIARDTDRKDPVGESVIVQMWQKFTKNGRIADVDVSREFADAQVIEPYVVPEGKSKAILVDIDGTLATMAGRSPYEWHRVGEDSPVDAVIEAVMAAYLFKRRVIVMSGRDESCRQITEEWLNTYLGVAWDELYMRPEGDTRKDNIVKYELFNNHVRDNFDVSYVLDDRDQVVEMWRKLGLACFQVNYGAF